DRLAVVPTANERDHAAEAALDCSHILTLRLKKLAELGGEREHARLAGLCLARVEAHGLAGEVDLSPSERQHLARHAPSGDVGERDRGADLFGKPAPDRLELLDVKEARAWCSFAQHGNVRTSEKLASLDRQGEGALQDGEVTVDGAIAGALTLA